MIKEAGNKHSKDHTTNTTTETTASQHTKTNTTTSKLEITPNSSGKNPNPTTHERNNASKGTDCSLKLKDPTDKSNEETESEEPLAHKTKEETESEDLLLANSETADSKTMDEEEKEDGDAVEESSDNPHPGVPVDHGWAWVIMGGQFVVTLLIVGYAKSLSIFFLEFLELFGVPVASSTIAVGIMTAFFGLGNVLVSQVLITRFDLRRLMLVGSLLNAVSIALVSFAPNMVYVTVMHCFIGFSHAFLLIPGTTILNHYFNKRRSFAMAVANTGLSGSNLIFPPLTQYLITSYGTRGALLLIAGVELQCVIAVCLMRPVSYYTKKKLSPEQTQSLHSEKDLLNISDINASSDRVKAKVCGEEGDTTARLLDETEETRRVSLSQSATSSPPITLHLLSTSVPEESVISQQSEHLSTFEEALHFYSHRTSMADRAFARQQSMPQENYRRAFARQQSMPQENYHRAFARQQSMPPENYRRRQPLANRQECRRKSVSAMTTSIVDICGSAATIPTDSLFLHSLSKVQEDKLKTRGGCCKRCKSAMLKIIDVSLFKNWLFLLIVVYIPLGFSAALIVFYFVGLAVANNVPRSDAALLLPILGGVDLVSRLCVGYLADLELFKRTHLVIVCMTIMGLACQFCRWYTSFGWLALFGVTFGLVGGSCSNLFVVVIIDLLGLDLLGKVMGLVLLVNCAFTSVNHVLIGALVDTTGSFVIPYHYIGGSMLLSALVLSMEPLARRLETKRLRKLESNSHSAREPVKD